MVWQRHLFAAAAAGGLAVVVGAEVRASTNGNSIVRMVSMALRSLECEIAALIGFTL